MIMEAVIVSTRKMVAPAHRRTSPLANEPGVSEYKAVLSAGTVYRNVLRDYPDVLCVPQVSAILGVSTKTVYKLLNIGALPSIKVGREFKIPKVYMLQYLTLLEKENTTNDEEC